MQTEPTPKPILPHPRPASGPTIYDRFRSVLKQREAEVNGFELSAEEAVRLYEDLLSELTFNSKPIITDLTIIAGELLEFGQGIADSICARIFEVPMDQKLPSLYLLDSIVKNIGRDYVKHFYSRLPEVFCEAYRQFDPSLYPSMRLLFGTWSSVFPPSVLRKIEAQLQFSSSQVGSKQESRLASSRGSESPRLAHGMHVNPNYLSQLEHSKADNVGARKFNATAMVGHVPAVSGATKLTPRLLGPLSPSGVGAERPVSSKADDIATGNSTWMFSDGASPSETAFSSGPGGPNLYSKLSNGLDIRGPRSLIKAYGDDRRIPTSKSPLVVDRLGVNGVGDKVAPKTWQNTEEEEFDWEDINPTLVGHIGSSDSQSTVPPLTSVGAQPCFELSGGGLAGRITGFRNERNPVAGSIQSQESLYVSHQFPQSANLLKSRKRGWDLLQTFSESNISSSGNEHLTALVDKHPNTDAQFVRPPSSISRIELSSHTSGTWSGVVPTTTGVWPPNDVLRSQPAPVRSICPLQKQVVGQFDPINSSKQYQANLLNQQNQAREKHLSLAVPSLPPRPLVPPLGHGYITQGLGAATSMLPSNLVPAVPLPLPMSKTFQSCMGLQPPLRAGPFSHQLMSIRPTTGQGGPNQPQSSAFSGLINSLMAQGLISLTKNTTEQDSFGLEFDLDRLKLRHESAINALYADLPRQCSTCSLRFKSQEAHSNHMDWHVTKNHMSKNRKQKPSRKWFVSTSMWLSGAEALGSDAVPGFLPAETVVEAKDDAELAVPADEGQSTCALCGEPFDDFYSDETDEWMYRGAVYLNAPEGSTAGMDRSQLGPMVHAKCRPEPSTAPSGDFE